MPRLVLYTLIHVLLYKRIYVVYNEEQNIIFYQYERKIMKRVLPLRLDQAASAGFAS